MEDGIIVLVFFGALILIGWIKALSDQSQQSSPTARNTRTAGSPNARPQPLQASVSVEDVPFDDVLRKSLCVKLRGSIKAPHANYEFKWQVRLLDGTHPRNVRPVATPIAELSDGETPWFIWAPDVYNTLPYAESEIQDWIKLPPFPLEILIPPTSGNRRIKAVVTAINRQGSPFSTATGSTVATFSEVGYEERRKNDEDLEEATIELAMAICAADGEIDKREKALVRDHCKRQLAYYDQSHQETVKNRLNSALRRSATGARLKSNTDNVNPLVERVAKLANDQERLAVMELCVDIVGADDRVDRSEAAFLEKIRKGLDIELALYRQICGRNIGADVETTSAVLVSLLGIRKGMNKQEIREILLTESRKWLDMQGSSDPERREKAARMLQQLAEIKKKFSA